MVVVCNVCLQVTDTSLLFCKRINMCNYPRGHVEDTEDDYDIDDLADDMGHMNHEREMMVTDSEDGEYRQSVCPSVISCCCVVAFGI
jgi:hypothetical protein